MRYGMRNEGIEQYIEQVSSIIVVVFNKKWSLLDAIVRNNMLLHSIPDIIQTQLDLVLND
jgi:hypothetical protein